MPRNRGDPNGYAAAIYLYAADLTLEQTAPPTASDVSGELASASVLSGTSDVVFSASDPGSGVYEALVSVDGQVVQRTVLDEDGGRCRTVGDATDGLPAFLYLQPCPAVSERRRGLRYSESRQRNAPPGGERDRCSGKHGDRAGQKRHHREHRARRCRRTEHARRAERHERLVAGDPDRQLERGEGRDLTSGYGRTQTVIGRLTDASAARRSPGHSSTCLRPRATLGREDRGAAARAHRRGRALHSCELPAGTSSRTLLLRVQHAAGRRAGGDQDADADRARGRDAEHRAAHDAAWAAASTSPGACAAARSPAAASCWCWRRDRRAAHGSSSTWSATDARGRYHASYRFKFPGPAAYQFRVLCKPRPTIRLRPAPRAYGGGPRALSADHRHAGTRSAAAVIPTEASSKRDIVGPSLLSRCQRGVLKGRPGCADSVWRRLEVGTRARGCSRCCRPRLRSWRSWCPPTRPQRWPSRR